MVHKIIAEPKAIKMTNERYRCNICNTVFSEMIVFRGWDFRYKIPRACPNCRAIFKNGNIDID